MDGIILAYVFIVLSQIYFTLMIRAANIIARASGVSEKDGMYLIPNWASITGLISKIIFWISNIALLFGEGTIIIPIIGVISLYIIMLLIHPSLYYILYSTIFVRSADRFKYIDVHIHNYLLKLLYNAGYISRI